MAVPSTGVGFVRNRILFGIAASSAGDFAFKVFFFTFSTIRFRSSRSAFSFVGGRVGCPVGSALGYLTIEATEATRDRDLDLGSAAISAATFGLRTRRSAALSESDRALG